MSDFCINFQCPRTPNLPRIFIKIARKLRFFLHIPKILRNFAPELRIEEFEIAYSGLRGVNAVAAEVRKKAGTHVLARGLCGSSRALLLASVFAQTNRHMLVVVEDAEEAGYLKSDIEKLVNPSVASDEGGEKSIRSSNTVW